MCRHISSRPTRPVDKVGRGVIEVKRLEKKSYFLGLRFADWNATASALNFLSYLFTLLIMLCCHVGLVIRPNV